MTVLALDPSSQCVGWALLRGLEPDDLLDGGRITPAKCPPICREKLPREVVGHLLSPDLAAWRRCESLADQVRTLLLELKCRTVVIEIPSGKIGTGARHGARGSLTTYGMAAGIILQTARALGYGGYPVTERQWTAGGGSKARRAQAVAAFYGGRYPMAKDPGLDVADAIGLGRWWLHRLAVVES